MGPGYKIDWMYDASKGAGTKDLPVKPAITATRLKGEPIMETRQVQVGTKPGKVLLELTPRAAETLLIIAQFIAGDPRTSRRGDVDKIASALWKADVKLPSNYQCGVKSGFAFTE